MRCTILMPERRRLVSGLAVGAMVLGSAGLVGTATHAATGQTAPAAKTPIWITMQGKVAHLTLIAAWNNANAGFNFDGGANGQMTVTVPLGDRIIGTFRNAASTPHDVRVIHYQKPLPSHTVALAFPGASAGGPTGGFGRRGTPGPGGGGPPPGTPDPGGAPRSNKPQTFSFVASKVGTYMIMCGFPGHALAGMWDTFVVSPTAKAASITFK